MTNLLIPAPYAEIRRYGKGNGPHEKMVRAYRSSPESVTLQIRTEKTYASVNLSFDDIRKLAAHLIAEVD